MVVFDDIQDVRDWLEPLSYEELFEATEPFGGFDKKTRKHYDRIIAKGEVDPELVLYCLKQSVQQILTDMFGLRERVYAPPPEKRSIHVH
ncbi:hypothetical protein SAMN06297129_3758 [Pseudooceanicola antarcticus]|uniref:Uncharacterized protein n=1 Tax=Pseudooceanicola antarcticus TaxID=1247613 RepID=A0A285JHY1_9RHOB|nr:hypothetical protein [Pseudooceanicola antarcticus]PJE26413.1 hypothetical protein CVM39_17875 [Pseudooceanicola antarcticus]SNY59417.1 hypothetical protein SAMN06297129_3758 [Pseudooceanicola antarcticus]